MTKLNIVLITVVSLGYSVHAREQYLRSVQSKTQTASPTANEDSSFIDVLLDWLDGEDNGSPAPIPTMPPESWSPPFAPWPTYSPTVTQVPTTSPAPSMCIGNTVGWVDSAGDGCDWYEAADLPGCPYYGNSFEGDMGVADDNCCYCAGTGAPTPRPTYSPTVSAAPSLCIGNTVGWVDSFGDGCDWYEASDSPGCPNFGDSFDGSMGVANDNCCYCAGTGAPSLPMQGYPTNSPTGPLVTTSPTATGATSTSSPSTAIATSAPTSAIPVLTLSPTPSSTASPSASFPATLTCPDTLNQSAEIDSGVTLFYALVPSDPVSGNGLFCGRLEAENKGWISIGFSPDGSMIGSQAVIGIPEQGTVLKYDLTSKYGNFPMSEDVQTLSSTSITVEGERAIMEFAKLLVETGEVPIVEDTENKFIYAAGDYYTEDGLLGMHSERTSFVITL